MWLGFAVTVETPFHAQWLNLVNHFHRVDSTVALNTADASIDVRCMIEIRVIRQIMDFDPLDRHARFITLIERLQLLAVRVHLEVTVHASLSRWDRCISGVFNGVVTVPAVDSEFTCMYSVTEWNGLCRHVTNVGCPGTETPCNHEDDVWWRRQGEYDDRRQKQV